MINRAKNHGNQILLINASKIFEKGRPKNYLPENRISEIANLYLGWKEENGISRIISKEEVVKNDYNLSPSRYVAQDGGKEVLALEDAIVLFQEAEEERREADGRLRKILLRIGVEL